MIRVSHWSVDFIYHLYPIVFRWENLIIYMYEVNFYQTLTATCSLRMENAVTFSTDA